MLTVYGIPNCDTVKKALDWLAENNIEYTFHNFKKEGITETKLQLWWSLSTPETLMNKKSTAWKGFTPAEQKTAATKTGAIKLMMANTNFIKRPVIEIAGTILNGFTAEAYKKAFEKL